MRTGLLAEKVGMTRVFRPEDGKHIPVTLLKVDNCFVVGQRTKEKDGYNALQLGCKNRKPKNVAKPQRQQFAKAKVEPKAKIAEFRIADDAFVDVGTQLSAFHFVTGQKVDVCGVNQGKGFQGGMKRHNFRGLEGSHGVSVSHRAIGSVGQCQEPGRVFKGKKMPGQMGNVRVTAQNLEIVSTDEETGIIAVKGSVPGSRGTFLRITDAVKRVRPDEAPFPAARLGSKRAAEAHEAAEKAAEEAVHEKLEARAVEADAAKAAAAEAEAAEKTEAVKNTEAADNKPAEEAKKDTKDES